MLHAAGTSRGSPRSSLRCRPCLHAPHGSNPRSSRLPHSGRAAVVARVASLRFRPLSCSPAWIQLSARLRILFLHPRVLPPSCASPWKLDGTCTRAAPTDRAATTLAAAVARPGSTRLTGDSAWAHRSLRWKI